VADRPAATDLSVAWPRPLQPDIRIIGVEASASPRCSAAIEGGATEIVVAPTLADGWPATSRPGSVTVDLVRRHVAIVTVTETKIIDAISSRTRARADRRRLRRRRRGGTPQQRVAIAGPPRAPHWSQHRRPT